jgi:hypothetical protein
MEERRVERHVERDEVKREEIVDPRAGTTTNVNIGPDGTTNVQESGPVEEIVDEPVETVEQHETTVERRVP